MLGSNSVSTFNKGVSLVYIDLLYRDKAEQINNRILLFILE